MPAAATLRARWPWAVAVLLLLLFVLQVLSVRDKTLTYDAPVHLRYGMQVLHGNAVRFDDSKMPVSALNALPGRVAQGMEAGPLRDALASTTAARIATMLASLGLALLVFLWARRLYGVAAGLLALLFHVFDPSLMAHGRLVTTDLYATLGVALAVYTFWRFLGARPGRARRLWGGAAALAFAAAQVAKYSAAYLVPVFLLILAVRYAPALLRELRSGERSGIGRRLLHAALWTGVFALVFLGVVHAAFLFEGTLIELGDYRFRSEPFQELQAALAPVAGLPVPLPYPYLEGLDWVLARERTGEGYGDIFLLGELRRGEGFTGYYAIVSLFKVPLPTQILFLAALAGYLARRRRFRFLRDELFLLAPVAFFVLYLNFFFQAQMGIRYSLVVFPFLYVFASSLLAPGGDLPGPGWLRERLDAGAPWAVVAPAVLAAWLVASVMSFYPHLIPYVNELLPDRTRAYRVFADSNLDWGQDIGAVERYLEEHPEVVWQPDEPTAGRILVGINWLDGVFARWGVGDTWIYGNFEPVGHFRYSHLFFEVSEEEAARLREERARGEEISPRSPAPPGAGGSPPG